MSYQPPYTITSKIVSLVADISERVGYFSALEASSKTLHLRRVQEAVLSSLASSHAAPTEQVTDQVTDQVTGQVTGQVTPQVARLLEVLVGEMPREEIQEAIGLLDRKSFRVLYLAPALSGRWIEMTIPDKPNSRFQKYRLTEQGRAWLSRRAKPSGAGPD